MKLNELPLIPQDTKSPNFSSSLSKVFRDIAQKVNAIAAGSYSGFDGQATAAPTTGTWRQGDYVKNSNPVEAGAASSRYVIHGWVCTVSGTPGTWLQDRGLTGN